MELASKCKSIGGKCLELIMVLLRCRIVYFRLSSSAERRKNKTKKDKKGREKTQKDQKRQNRTKKYDATPRGPYFTAEESHIDGKYENK